MTTLNAPLLGKVAEEAGIGYVKCYDPFHLVAILEAKATDIGYHLHTGYHEGYYLSMVSVIGAMETEDYDFNPTNPISTANAKIRCLAEVFGVEA